MARKRQRGRAIDGIFLLDKPIGLSSNKALQITKSIFFAQKAGHTGSLDPLATGMLPICFGEATKFSQFLLDADKAYTVTAKLGERTTTCDTEGEVIMTGDASHLTQAVVETCLEKFRGEIQQIPSMFSALKYQGKPLYEYARKGIEVPREPRAIRIDELTLITCDLPHITLHVRCSKGTYIRNLVDDIGESLGCYAHVTELRRTKVANFTENEMVTLDHIRHLREQEAFAELDELILPLSKLALSLPSVKLSSEAAFQLRQGQFVVDVDLPIVENISLLYNDEFIGIGEVTEEKLLKPKRLIKLTEL